MGNAIYINSQYPQNSARTIMIKIVMSVPVNL